MSATTVAKAQQGYGYGISKIRFGSAYDNSANPMVLYGTSYVGFNLEPQLAGSTWQWNSDTDGGNNGASLIYGDVAGSLNFITIPTQAPAAGQSITSQNLVNNYRAMTLYKDGRLQIGRQQPDMSAHGDYKLAVAGKTVSQSLELLQRSIK